MGISDKHAKLILEYIKHALTFANQDDRSCEYNEFTTLCYAIYKKLAPAKCPEPIHSKDAQDKPNDVTYCRYGGEYFPGSIISGKPRAGVPHLSPKNITADGACLFRSIMMAISGDEKGHLGLRLHTTLHMIL